MADATQEQAANQQQGGQEQQSHQNQNPGQATDVQAQIDAALAAQQSAFAKQLKEATGHDDLKALTEAKLLAEGKLQELATAKTREADAYKTRFEQVTIGNALLQAAAGAVDPALVVDLLQAGGVCDDNGKVTIAGKPVAEAVAALLAAKPFLARPQGSGGSGAPASGNSGGVEQAAKADELSPLERLKAARKQGAN